MKKCLSFLRLLLLSNREVEFLTLLFAKSDFEVELNFEGTLRVAYSNQLASCQVYILAYLSKGTGTCLCRLSSWNNEDSVPFPFSRPPSLKNSVEH